jgi:hypothetical protein
MKPEQMPNPPINAALVLTEMLDTFRERAATYKDNFITTGKVMEVLFPNGMTLETANDQEIYHLFSWVVGKLTRFASTDLKHLDSIHDLAVYAAMIEASIRRHAQEKK